MAKKVYDEVLAAAAITPKRGEDTQTLLKRVVVALGEAEDAVFNKLSKEAVDWYNDGCDQLEAKKDVSLPEGLEAEKEEEPAATVTRRRPAKTEDEPAVDADAEPQVGDTVKAVTKRDKTYEGEVTEVDAEIIVVGEQELDRDKLKSLVVVKAGKSASKPKPAAAEADEPADPGVGDTVQVVTSRDKTIMGNITVLDGDDLVITDGSGAEHELSLAKLKSVTVKVKANADKKGNTKADDKDAEKPAKRGAAKEDDKPAKRASNGGVSVGQRIKELILDDMEAPVEKIGKALEKEKLDFRPNTLDLVFAETHKFLKLLRERKMLKA